MRPSIHRQLPLVAPPISHEHCREVMQMGALLDAHPEIEAMVAQDLVAEGICRNIGRTGMSADQVLRPHRQADEPVQLRGAGVLSR